MEDFSERDTREQVSEARRLEMEKYGRSKVYDIIFGFLPEDERVAFSLVNHVPAILDDIIDTTNESEKQLNRAEIILTQGFQGRAIEVAETWEQYVYSLGQALSRLHKGGFIHAVDIFNEVVNYWKIEARNLSRRGEILNSNDLDSLNLGIGESVSLQFLYLLCPQLDRSSRESVASIYGLAIKLADNLSDLDDDIQRGEVNIPRESVARYNLDLLDLSKGDFQSYKEFEFMRVKQCYEEGDKIVDELLTRYSSQKEGLLAFKEFCHSWLRQASDIMQEES